MNILKWFKKKEKITNQDLRPLHIGVVQLKIKFRELRTLLAEPMKIKKNKESLLNVLGNINHILCSLEEDINDKIGRME